MAGFLGTLLALSRMPVVARALTAPGMASRLVGPFRVAGVVFLSRRVIMMADINAWYSRLLAADEARDAAALAAVAWQMYGQLATTAADLGALRARFRVYATAPRASGRRRPAPRVAQIGDRAAAA